MTARKIRRELEESGELTTELREEGLNIIQADFDEECRMAIGISFDEWLKTKTKRHRRIFSFCQRVWEKVFDDTLTIDWPEGPAVVNVNFKIDGDDLILE